MIRKSGTVFRKDHAQTKDKSGDDDSKKVIGASSARRANRNHANKCPRTDPKHSFNVRDYAASASASLLAGAAGHGATRQRKILAFIQRRMPL